jgi:hypothetical protein
VFHEALLHLIVAGNALVYIDETDGLKVFHLNRYACRRDGMGRPLDAVVCESFTEDSLPKKVSKALGLNREEDDLAELLRGARVLDAEEIIHVYTHIEWEHDQGEVCWYQEVRGMEIEGSKIKVPIGQDAWLPLRMVRIDGEDYGIAW